jgi:hypothetical protein
MAQFRHGKDDEKAEKRFAELFGPAQIDHMIRQALYFCWMGLPRERRNMDEWEKQVRRIFERAVRDFREDSTQFGRPA